MASALRAEQIDSNSTIEPSPLAFYPTGSIRLVAACFMLLSHGTNLFGAVLASPDFWLTPLRLIALLPVYVLWALPTVGWLLMVSSMARASFWVLFPD